MIYFVGRVYIYNRSYLTLKHSLILFRKCKLELDLFFFSPEKCYYFQNFFLSKRYLRYHNFHTYNVRIIAISYLSENHFRTITILYPSQFVPYADRYIMTIPYHMQIDTLWPFRTICRSTHYDHFVPYADWHIWPFRTILKNTLWPFRTICR